MPAMTFSATVTGGTTLRDVFAPQPFARALRPSRYRLYGRHAAGAGTVVASVRHGRVVDGEALGMVAASGAPVVPDDLICESFLTPGEDYKVDLSEIAGTNTTTQLRVLIDEI